MSTTFLSVFLPLHSSVMCCIMLLCPPSHVMTKESTGEEKQHWQDPKQLEQINSDIDLTYCPSRYHGFMREKSVSCDSLGSLFIYDMTNWSDMRRMVDEIYTEIEHTLTCSQFCIVNASI